MAKKKENEQEGVWRTIGGRRVFIKKGQSLSDAMRESGKFNRYSEVKREQFQKTKADIERKEKRLEAIDKIDGPLENWRKANAQADKSQERYEDLTKKHEEYKGDTSDLKGKHIEKKNNSREELKKIRENSQKYETAIEEEKRLDEANKQSWENEEKANKKLSREYKKEEKIKDMVSKGMTEQEYKEGEYSFEGKTKQDKINDLYDKMQNEKNIFKKGEIQEEIDMLKDDFKGTKEEYRNYIANEQEKRLAEYQKEKEERQTQIKQQRLDKAIRTANTQKSLKELASDGIAKDITNLSDEETKKLRDKHGHLEVMRVIHGTYGMNGAILKSYETGEYFVITSRNGNLFYWV